VTDLQHAVDDTSTSPSLGPPLKLESTENRADDDQKSKSALARLGGELGKATKSGGRGPDDVDHTRTRTHTHIHAVSTEVQTVGHVVDLDEILSANRSLITSMLKVLASSQTASGTCMWCQNHMHVPEDSRRQDKGQKGQQAQALFGA